jgi:hypothetical protein
VTSEIRRFRASDIPAIERLNRRLEAVGLPHQIGRENGNGDTEPSLDVEPIIQRLYVAVDDKEIRGGAWLKEQLFWVDGQAVRIGWANYPVAESLVDKKSAGVPASMLFSLLRQQPYLMALGMGGHNGAFARLLAAARWANSSLPFFFLLVHPSRVLRQLSYARCTPLRRALADILAYSGLGWLGYKSLTYVRAMVGHREPSDYISSVVDHFDTWADELWERCRDSYGFIAVRNSQALNSLYPGDFKNLARLRVLHDGGDIGWICVRSIDAAGTWYERHFGNLKLGILTDCLAQPTDAPGVIAVGVSYLLEQGVDLIVTNLGHPAWCAAARGIGFLSGPSNCAFYRSPAVEKLLTKATVKDKGCHLTCSDGDGPEPI